ncbi:MAG: hypothetical protein NXI20_26110, partial [bacterium]|nr:hypothetical protein [bacterium]
MKKFLILLFIVVLGAAGFFGYNYYFGWANLNKWSFISEDIPLVYEYESSSNIRNDLNDKKVWKSFTNLAPVAELRNSILSLDSMVENSTILENLLSNNTILLGITPVSKSKFDFLVVFSVKNIDQFDAIGRIIEKGYKVKTRKYEGFTISDIVANNGDRKFTYIFHKSFFIGSQTPFLVEDAIRTITDPNSRNFQEKHEELFKLAKLQNDAGNLYLNSKKISAIADVIASSSNNIKKLNSTTSSTFLDARIAEDHLLLNGFSLNQPKDFLSVFDGNLGKPMTQMSYIPNSSIAITHVSFEDAEKYLENIAEWTDKNDPSLSVESNTIATRYDINFKSYSSWMANESCVYTSESSDPNNPNQTALISLKDPDLSKQQLEELSKRVSNVRGDSIFYEIYGDLKIVYLPIANFPASFLGPPFTGFETSYYTYLEDQLVISDNLQSIKDLVDERANENVWSKSLKVNNFLEICNKESNLSYFLNVPIGWRTIQNNLNQDWQEFVETQSSLIKSFELVALQFSNVDDKYFTNLALYHPGEFQPVATGKTLKPVASLELAYPLITKPFIVRNHSHNTMEMMVQDSTNTLYLLNESFEVIWDDSIGSSINTDISQVDYYKNNKLQYLFGAGNEVHLMDRTGKDVESYPIAIGESALSNVQVVDYNKTKAYRWSVTNNKKQFYLTDKEGKPLNGWNPYPNPYEGDGPIKHFRIRGKDIFVTIEESGKVNLLSRNGTAYKGFPILYQEPIDDNYVITASSNFSRSILTMITKSGELTKYNLLGQLQYKEQLVKASGDSEFSILKDKNSIKFLILRQDDNKIAILERNGTERFSKSYLSEEPVQAQYYDFGPGQELIILRDTQQDYAYLYNGKGELLNNLPIETNQDLSVLFYEREGLFKVYKVYD